MGDCFERDRISRDIAVTIRDMLRLKSVRKQSPHDATRIDTFFIVSHKLARLRADYRQHVERHGCLETPEAKFAKSAADQCRDT